MNPISSDWNDLFIGVNRKPFTECAMKSGCWYCLQAHKNCHGQQPYWAVCGVHSSHCIVHDASQQTRTNRYPLFCNVFKIFSEHTITNIVANSMKTQKTALVVYRKYSRISFHSSGYRISNISTDPFVPLNKDRFAFIWFWHERHTHMVFAASRC